MARSTSARPRHPRRRGRPVIPPPRERAGAVACSRAHVASYWMHNAWITTSGEKISKSLGNSLLVHPCSSMCAASSCATTWSRRTTARRWSSASKRWRSRRRPFGGSRTPAALPAHRANPRRGHTAFSDAMNDDLSTPAAVAVIPRTVAEGNRLARNVPDPERPSGRPRGSSAGDARRPRAGPG